MKRRKSFLSSSSTRPSFWSLVRDKRFSQLLHLCRETKDTAELRQWIRVGDGTASSPAYPIHTLLKHNPPPELIDLLLDTENHGQREQHQQPHGSCSSGDDGSLSLVTDEQGRTPLHVAVASGCDKSIVAKLLSVDSIQCLDLWQRTPLHWACCCAGSLYGNYSATSSFSSKGTSLWRRDRRRERKNRLVRVVFLLLDAYPPATRIRDVYGMTPMMLALQHHVDHRIIERIAHQHNNIFCKEQCWKHYEGGKSQSSTVHDHKQQQRLSNLESLQASFSDSTDDTTTIEEITVHHPLVEEHHSVASVGSQSYVEWPINFGTYVADGPPLPSSDVR